MFLEMFDILLIDYNMHLSFIYCLKICEHINQSICDAMCHSSLCSFIC